MKSLSESYVVAKHIHDTFFGDNDVITEEEFEASGVRCEPASQPHHTPKLYISGELEQGRVYQTLSRGRNGDYYLTTVPYASGSAVERLRITPFSPTEKLGVLATSLYMKVLVDIAMNRE